MRCYLFVRQTLLIFCFLLLALAACGPEPETAATPPPLLATATATTVTTATGLPTETAVVPARPTSTPSPTTTATVAVIAALHATPSPSPTLSLEDEFWEMSRIWRVAYFDASGSQICAVYADGNDKSCLDFNNIPNSYASKGFLSWSPDGNKLAIATECNVYIWTVGGNLSSLRDARNCGTHSGFKEPEWSPDGSFIAYTSEELYRVCPYCQAYLADVFLDSLDGTIHRPITADFEGWSYSPAWSPDGRSMAFAFSSSDFPNEEIFVYSLDGNQAINLTQDPARDVNPVWSPDSQFIAFLSDRGGAFDLYSMHSDGSGTRKLAQLGADSHWPYSSYQLTWLPNGKYILYNDKLIALETGNITTLHFAFDTLYASWFTLPESARALPVSTPHCATGWSQLHASIHAVITGGPNDPPNRVRSAPDTNAEVLTRIYPGHIVLVSEGPVCTDGLVFWQVESQAIPGGVGWTAEGDGQEYWLEPVAETAVAASQPMPCGGPYVPDANTLLLLSFDNHYEGAQGEVGNAVGTTFTTGKYGQAVVFDANDRLTLATADNLSLEQGSIEFWLRPNWDGNDEQNYVFFEVGDEWPNRLRLMKDGANNLRFITWDGDTEYGVATHVAHWRAGEWHHVAASWEGTEIALFVDCVEQDRFSPARLPDMLADTIHIGAATFEVHNAEAAIDELRIANIPFSGGGQ